MDRPARDSRTPVSCNLCASDEPRTICVENSFPICRCDRCGLIYVNPQPAEEPGYWRDDHVTEDPGFEATKRPVFEDGLATLRRLRPRGGRVLDLGCGFGSFLELAGVGGWEPHGVDVSEIAVAHARDVKGLRDVRCGDLATVGHADATFDAVTLWNVLDHVADPLGTLREVHRVLDRGGLVVVRVPNMVFHGAVARARRLRPSPARRPARFLAGIAPPRRLFGFTPRTLRRMLEEAGFVVVELSPARHYGTGRDPLVTTVELASRAAYRATAHRVVASPTLVAVAEKPSGDGERDGTLASVTTTGAGSGGG